MDSASGADTRQPTDNRAGSQGGGSEHGLNDNGNSLLPQHAELLNAYGISSAVQQARGCWSEKSQAALVRLGFARSQCLVPSLVVPLRDLQGEIVLYQLRPDQPRIVAGDPVKYEIPKGSHFVIDVPPTIRIQVGNQAVPLYITVGVQEADAAAGHGLCCLALLQPHGWAHQDTFWDQVPLEHRQVYVVCDSQVASNPRAAKAAEDLVAFLRGRGAQARFILLPPGEGGRRTKLDEFLARCQSTEELLALATDGLPKLNEPEAGTRPPTHEVTKEGIFALIPAKNGFDRLQLTNFDARVVTEVVFPDDHVPREFEIEAHVQGKRSLIRVSADVFDEMEWVRPKLGINAVIYDRSPRRSATLVAIQTISGLVSLRVGTRRLGWHNVDGKSYFVHAGGIQSADSPTRTDSGSHNRSDAKPLAEDDLRDVGPEGPVPQTADTDLPLRARIPPVLGEYCLPPPSSGEDLLQDARKSLSLLEFGPLEITVPLYASIWRAILDVSDMTIHVYGPTGSAKTERVSLHLQHFGLGLDARNPISTLRDTRNFRIAVMAAARNVLVLVDDIVPEGSRGDINGTYREAADFVRGQGNAAGRGRCNPDGSPRAPEPPGGLPITTGEVSLPGHSLNARMISVEEVLNPRDEDTSARLSEFQEYAREGAFTRFTSALITWLAPQYEEKRRQMREQAAHFRTDLFLSKCSHARTASAMAELLASLEILFEFLMHIGMIDERGFQKLWEIAHDGLYRAIEHQREVQSEEDPAERYLTLLGTAVATGYGYFEYLTQENPGDALGDKSLFGYTKKIRLVPNVQNKPERVDPQNSDQSQRQSSPPAGDDNDAGADYGDRVLHVDADGPEGYSADDSQDAGHSCGSVEKIEYEEKEEWQAKGRLVGWKHFDSLYIDPKASLAVVNELADRSGEHPIPLRPKALGKQLAARGYLASKLTDRNTSRIPIQGIKRGVFHVMTFKFFEFYRTDEDWSTIRDEENLLAYEHYLHRQQEREKTLTMARQRASYFMQQCWINELFPK